MYNWSPNCCRLFSNTASISGLDLERTAVTARRMEMPSPTPAPEELHSQFMRCAIRDSSSFSTMLIIPAAAEITSLSDLNEGGVPSEIGLSDRYTLDISLRIP